MSEQDLDTRIRTLVARAVADAPAAPEIESAHVVVGRRAEHDRRPHRGWWIGGGAAVLAAAAAITTVVLVADTDDRISTPSATTVPPAVTTIPPTGPATTVPATTVPEAGPTVPVVVPPTATPTTPTTPQQSLFGEEFATAGPDGVVLRDKAGTELRRLDQRALRALPVGDGRVVVELGTPEGVETEVIIWYADGTTSVALSPIEPPDGRIAIEDVAVVGGRPVVLFQYWRGSQETVQSVLYVAPLTIDGFDESQAVSLGVVGGYEWGLDRLHLANTGLVVGTSSNESSYSLYVAAMPGTPAVEQVATLTPDALGLDESYSFVGDCGSCPTGFGVDADGARLGWFDGTDLVVTNIASLEQGRTPLASAHDPSVDVDLTGDGAVFSYGPFGERPPLRLVGEELTPLEGFAADVGPTIPMNVGVPTPPATPAAPDRVVTAGPAGVAVLENGVEVRRLDQPAEVAFGTPGGAVIFQPARPSPEGQPGDPLIWRPDGTVERLLGELPELQSYRLHDVTEVAGVPTVLYGIATRAAGEGAEMDVRQFTEVLHALTMTPGGWTDAVLDEMPTWESGWSQLTLTEDGLVVGEQSAIVEHHLYSVVVPGSPAAATGPLEATALGLRASYGDEDAPHAFGISPDGTTVVWTFGTDFVVHTLATGAERHWAYPGLADGAVRGLAVRLDDDGAVTVAVVTGWPQTTEGTAADVVTLRPDGSVAVVPVTAAFASFAP